ncbi:MAG: DUF2092 domain-containing protein [Chloroflexota bacterium]
MKKSHVATPIAVMVVLGGVISGCTAGQQVTAADIMQKMRDTMKTTTSVQGTFDFNLTINKDGLKTLISGLAGSMGGMMGGAAPKGGMMDAGNIDLSHLPDTASATINYWRQSPDKMRAEVVTASYPEAKGATVVYDGQKVYALDAKNNTVYTGTPSKMMDKVPAQMKGMLASVDVEKELDKIISAADVKLLGSEKVAGLDAYKLDVTMKPDAATLLGLPQMYAMQAGVLIKDLHATLYVDQNRWIPLKFTIEHPNMGSFTYSASKLDLNSTIDAATFVLQVPAGSKTVDLDQMADKMQPKQTTLPAAQAAAQADGWKLLEPSYLPVGATLVGVTQMQHNMGGGFMLSYSAPSADFTLMQGKTEIERGLGDDFSGVNGSGTGAMKDVTVRGVQAKAFSPDGAGWTALIWQEKDSGVWVAIRGKLSLDETLKIAEGLK